MKTFTDFAAKYGLAFFPNGLNENHTRIEKIEAAIRADVLEIHGEFGPYAVKGLDLEFHFLEKTSIGAKACTSNGKDFAGITLGTFFLVRDVIGRILEKDGCHLVPNGEIFQSVATLWTNEIDLSSQMSNDSRFVSNNPDNIELLDNVVLHACRFLFHHEMCHIWNGHAEWLDDGLTLANVAIDMHPNPISIDHVLELDADAKAASATLNGLTKFHYFGEEKFFHSIGLNGNTFEKNAYLAISSIYIMMRILLYIERRSAKLTGTHPSAQHRLIWVMENVFWHYYAQSNQFELKIIELFLSAIHSIEHAFCEVTGDDLFDIFEQQNNREATLERLGLLKIWSVIYNELDQRKRGKKVTEVRGEIEFENLSSRFDILIDSNFIKPKDSNFLSITYDYYRGRLFQQIGRYQFAIVNEEQISQMKVLADRIFQIYSKTTWNLNFNDDLTAWDQVLDEWSNFNELVSKIADNPSNLAWDTIVKAIIFSDPILRYVDEAILHNSIDYITHKKRSKVKILESSLTSCLKNLEGLNNLYAIEYPDTSDDLVQDLSVVSNAVGIISCFVGSVSIQMELYKIWISQTASNDHN